MHSRSQPFATISSDVMLQMQKTQVATSAQHQPFKLKRYAALLQAVAPDASLPCVECIPSIAAVSLFDKVLTFVLLLSSSDNHVHGDECR